MPVAQSSHLQTHDYDPDSETLTIQFQNGAVYTYAGVPQGVYDGFRQNGGAGTYFWTKIRNQYPATKIAAGSGKQS